MISARTSSRTSFETAKRSRTSSTAPACAATVEHRAIGAMSGRSTLIGQRTSTSPMSLPQLDLYDRNWPIWTFAEITPPAKFVHDQRRPSRTRDVTRWSRVAASYPGRPSGIRCCSPACTFGPTHRWRMPSSFPTWRLGGGAQLSRVIVDRGVRIPAGLVVGEDPEFDAARFRRTKRVSA